jgi:hypothetical protein
MDNQNIKILRSSLKSKVNVLKEVQADIQLRIKSIQKEIDEIMEYLRKKEGKGE